MGLRFRTHRWICMSGNSMADAFAPMGLNLYLQMDLHEMNLNAGQSRRGEELWT